MSRLQCLTALIEREDEGFFALRPGLDIASQGSTIEKSRTNLVEALTLLLETAEEYKVARR